MWSQLDRAVLPTLVILVIVLGVKVASTGQRVAKAVQSRYPVLWDELGGPNPALYVALGFDIFMILTICHPKVTAWFIKGQYVNLNDAEINLYAGRLKFYGGFYATMLLGILVYVVVHALRDA
jgi:hypothetical protein